MTYLYIPPLIALTSAIIVVLVCFLIRIPFFIIGLLSIVMMIYVMQDHYYRFSSDYANAISPAFFRQRAQPIIILVLIVMSIGFILLRFGPIGYVKDSRESKGFIDRFTNGFTDFLYERSKNSRLNTFRFGRY
jgi:hypothetical protein